MSAQWTISLSECGDGATRQSNAEGRRALAGARTGALDCHEPAQAAVGRRTGPRHALAAPDSLSAPRNPQSCRLCDTQQPRRRFCLTPKVRSLSDGFLEDDWIADVAAPEMAQFTRDLVWPAALMTFDRGRMLVRETTHEASVLSIDHGMVGRSLPMLRTAAGRCYLACCSTSERRAILEMLARSPAAEDEGAREKERVGALLDAIRAKGFAIQDREINPKATGMAIPIRAGAHILGCLSLIWISSALTIAEAEQRLLPPLRSVAERIEQAVGARSARRGGYAA